MIGPDRARPGTTKASHDGAPGTFCVIAVRVARAFATGSRRANRLPSGRALVRSTARIVSRSVDSATCVRAGTVLSHAMASRAPWSANCVVSSSLV